MTGARSVLRKRLFAVVRVLVSVALIGYLLATANLGELISGRRSWNGVYFVVALMLGVARYAVFAYRWKVTFGVTDTHVSFLALVKLYFIGAFFNLFLPTALGGDVVRGYDLAVHSGKSIWAAASVLVERVVGLFALAFTGLFALLIGNRLVEDTAVTTFILIVYMGYFVLAAIVFDATVVRRLAPLFRLIKFLGLGDRILRLYDSLYTFTQRRTVLWRCFVLSLAGQTLAVLAAYTLGLAINMELALVHFFIVLPLIWILTMIPLSINGLGIREGAFVFFFTRAGVPSSAALLLSFLNFSQTAILGLFGGVIYLLSHVFAAAKPAEG